MRGWLAVMAATGVAAIFGLVDSMAEAFGVIGVYGIAYLDGRLDD